jgi:hypothetical protein
MVMKHVLWFAAICVFIVGVAVVGYIAGFEGGRYSERMWQESQEFDMISHVIDSNPAYEGVVITACDGSHRLAGEVRDSATRDRLHSDMRNLFGDKKAEQEMGEVRIKQ